jgi:hypothetical protein
MNVFVAEHSGQEKRTNYRLEVAAVNDRRANSSASANLLLKLFDIWIHAAHALSKGGIRRPTSNVGSGKDGDDDDNDGDGDGSDDDKDHDDLFHPTEAEESTCWSSHGTGR